MKVAVFSTRPTDKVFFQKENEDFQLNLRYFEASLREQTVSLASGFDAVCAFVNDDLGRSVLLQLKELGVKIIALRCAGFNQVDLEAAKELNLPVVRVPAYSPYAVAEHTLALLLCLNRRIHRAFNRVREGNFNLEGLLGFDLHDKTVGVVGTGKIGRIVVGILKGFGSRVLCYDPYPVEELKEFSCDLNTLFHRSDIISLHCPLTPDSYHLINEEVISQMKDGVILVNTSRGGLIDAKAIIKGLKSGKVGGLAIDVYEEEGDLFFEDLSNHVIQDDVFARLTTFPNVLITGHQAFFTDTALSNIARTTLNNLNEFNRSQTLTNQVSI